MSLLDQARVALAPHIAPLRARFEALPVRDQGALLVLTAFLAVLLLVFAVWWPSHKAMAGARQQYQNMQGTLGWMQANAARARAAAGNGVASTGESVLSVVSNSAAANGFTLRRFEPEGERVRIWLDGVAFNKVATWLAELERQGISASDAQIERQQDSGLVSVRLSLGR